MDEGGQCTRKYIEISLRHAQRISLREAFDSSYSEKSGSLALFRNSLVRGYYKPFQCFQMIGKEVFLGHGNYVSIYNYVHGSWIDHVSFCGNEFRSTFAPSCATFS